MKSSLAILYTTIDSQENAENLARLAISSKVATCVNIISNGKSIYLYNNQIAENNEIYLIFKTSTLIIEQLEKFILEQHSYDLPAIIKFYPESSMEFLSYIEANLKNNQLNS